MKNGSERTEGDGQSMLMLVLQSPTLLIACFVGALILMGLGGVATHEFFPEDVGGHLAQIDRGIDGVKTDVAAMKLDLATIKVQTSNSDTNYSALNQQITKEQEETESLDLRVTAIEADAKARLSVEEARRTRQGR